DSIGDNQFSGTLPDFIQNWTGLERLCEASHGCCFNQAEKLFDEMLQRGMKPTLFKLITEEEG
ncbi:hypothetical protein A2U01_0019860, partial [Trifolium medium]|nr:hypothetical protein [Trifolium medium]